MVKATSGDLQRFDDPYEVYEVADGIYWVGFADFNAGFSNNPYLVVRGSEAVLIDPGSVLHYHVVAKKVLQVVRPEQIKAIILQHQDPDLCASVPKFEALIPEPIKVVVPPRAALFMPYYGITSELVTPSNEETMALAGMDFQFLNTPYVHFAGAFMTWHRDSATLFSSDVFGGLTKDWHLFADEKYVEATRAFTEPYISSDRAWRSAVKLTRSLSPALICPQHGSIIKDDIEAYLDAVSKFEVGKLLPSE